MRLLLFYIVLVQLYPVIVCNEYAINKEFNAFVHIADLLIEFVHWIAT